MDIKTANVLYDNGTFSDMYQSGFITNKVFTYREIYLWVDLQMRIRGIRKNKAVGEAVIKFGQCELTIWRALRCFTK